MLEIKQSDLHKMELFLNQSAKGYHFLFDHKKVIPILKTPTEEKSFFNRSNMERIQELLVGLLSQKSFCQKQDYLNSLNHYNFELLVRTYFHILDSTVRAGLINTH